MPMTSSLKRADDAHYNIASDEKSIDDDTFLICATA